jgi:hypothetical protein
MLFLEIVHNLPLTQFEVLGTFEIRIGTLLDIGKDRRGEVLILSFFSINTTQVVFRCRSETKTQ